MTVVNAAASASAEYRWSTAPNTDPTLVCNGTDTTDRNWVRLVSADPEDEPGGGQRRGVGDQSGAVRGSGQTGSLNDGGLQGLGGDGVRAGGGQRDAYLGGQADAGTVHLEQLISCTGLDQCGRQRVGGPMVLAGVLDPAGTVADVHVPSIPTSRAGPQPRT
jgi:hypothetical protein